LISSTYVEDSAGRDDDKSVNKVEDVKYATERQWHSYYDIFEEDHENNQTVGVNADTQLKWRHHDVLGYVL